MIVTVKTSIAHLRRAMRGSGLVARCRKDVVDMYPKPETRNPRTDEQQATRAGFSQGSGQWSGFSVEEKGAWNQFAADHARYYVRQSAEPLTGYRLYKSAVHFRQVLGLSAPLEAPRQPPPPALKKIELLPSAEADTFRFRVEHDLGTGSRRHVVVSISPAMARPSHTPQRKQGRYIHGWGVASTAPLPASGGEVVFTGCRFAIEPGNRFGVWMRIVSEEDGLSSPELFADLVREEPEAGGGG